MAYNTRPIKKDVDGRPIPQYFNPITDQYEPLYGVAGAARSVLYGPDGQPISASNRLPVDVGGAVDISDRANRQLGQVTLSGSDVQIEVTQLINAEPLSAGAGIEREFDLQTYGELVAWIAIDRQYRLQFYQQFTRGYTNLPIAATIADNMSPPPLGRTHVYNITQYLPAHTGILLVVNLDTTETATVSLWIGRVKRL